MASRAKREAAAAALAAWQGLSLSKAADAIEVGGMRRATRALEANGFVYDQTQRAWLIPANALTRQGYSASIEPQNHALRAS